MMKFTQEIKDKWLDALRSGRYVQARGCMHDETGGLCCLEVFNVSNKTQMVFSILDYEITRKLIEANDISDKTFDYSNVIPLIEPLKVQE